MGEMDRQSASPTGFLEQNYNMICGWKTSNEGNFEKNVQLLINDFW